MKTLTPDAQRRLDQYLRQVRFALSGCRSVSTEEVERDIREHIESELPTEGDAGSLRQLDDVLRRLGSPSQWVPPDEISPWRRFILRLRTGPEDWRLAYLAFGMFVVAILFPSSFWLLIPGSYLVSRAALAVAREQNGGLGAQRWFIYPSLLAVDAVLLFFALAVPPLLAGSGVIYLIRTRSSVQAYVEQNVPIVLFVMTIASGAWLFFLGMVLAAWPALARNSIRPLGDNFDRKSARFLKYAGLGMLVLCAVGVLLLVGAAALLVQRDVRP